MNDAAIAGSTVAILRKERQRRALEMFRGGFDTVEIAKRSGITETEAADLVHEGRELARTRR